MKNTKVKAIIKSIISVVCFLVLLAVCTYYVDRTLKDKGNYLKYKEFYEEEEPFDVLFFGSSRMLNGVYPMELWDDFGLTTFNMAQHSEGTLVSYWQMKNAFHYNKPKVAVVDLTLLYDDKIMEHQEQERGYLHKSLDHMPLSKIKYDALKDVTEGIDIGEYLFPLAMYHNRWNDLEEIDVYLELPQRKGAEARVGITKMYEAEWEGRTVATSINTEMYRLDAMVELCEEEDVQLIFTLMPATGMSELEAMGEIYNYLELYAQEHNIPFLNFEKDKGVVNYTTDFYDNSHLNPNGAKKVTYAIGEFLMDNYEFAPKSAKTQAAWNQAWSDNLGAKLGEMILHDDHENLNFYLLLVNDNTFCFDIKMPDVSYIEAFGAEDMFAELKLTKEDIIFDSTEDAVVVTVYDEETGAYFHSAKFIPKK